MEVLPCPHPTTHSASNSQHSDMQRHLYTVCVPVRGHPVRGQYPYLLQADQQVPDTSEGGALGPQRGGEHVTAVAQLVAALDNQRQGVVVTGSQLMPVEDDDLGTAHLVLSIRKTE